MRMKAETAAAAVFFIIVFLYFWLRVDPRLIYHAQEPPFLLGAQFFSNFSQYPGGLIWYISAFFTQFYIYPLLGAFIITLLIFLNYWQTVVFLRQQSIGINNHRETAFGLLPAVLLFAAYCNYLLPLSYAMGIFITLLSSNFYTSCSSCKTYLRLLLFVILVIIVYYSTGTCALLFAAICGLDELFSRKKYLISAAIVVITSLLPFIAAKYFFVISVQSAYYDFIGLKTYLLEAAQYPRIPPIVYGVYFLFPALVVVRFLYSVIGKKTDSKVFLGGVQGNSHGNSHGYWLLIAAIAAALTYTSCFCFNTKAKANYQIDYYARYRLWDKIVQTITPANLQEYSVLSQMHLFRALYYRNRLLSGLFTYPPLGLPGLSFQMITRSMAQYYPVQMSDLYFEVGGLNQAEYWAHEALALKGKKPWILQRLALINLLKGKKNSAEKFIALLGKALFDKKNAMDCTGFLENDSLIIGNEYLRQIRSYKPHKEYLCRDFYSELVNLFDNNSENRIAFEYIVAENLLNNSISPIVDNTGYFAKFGYDRFPRHVQEALVLQLVLSNTNPATIDKYKLDSDYYRQFNNFNRILFQYKDDRVNALKELAPQYGTTYWYYLASNERPVFLKKKE